MLIPGLQAKAVEVTFNREGKQEVRIVRLEKVREQPSALSVDTKKSLRRIKVNPRLTHRVRFR